MTRLAVIAAVCTFVPSPGGPGPTRVTAAPAQATPATPAPAVQDPGWPRAYTTQTAAHLIVYQPQISAWPNHQRMTLYSAVSYTPKGATKAALGTIKVEADTRVSVADRLVDFSTFTIEEANFPTLAREQVQDIIAEITRSIPLQERVIALDRVLANLDTSSIIPKNVDGVKADPPALFFSQTAAILVNLDGDPIWSPVAGTDLRYAINTNWDFFEHTPSKALYVRHDRSWMTATALTGPWTPVTTLPESFSKVPEDDNYKDVRDAVPGRKLSAGNAPRVFVSTTPAELILTTGAPRYQTVTGTALQWVSNTESDVFRMGRTGLVYYLVAGRWFSAPDFTGPWTFATTNLPADFQKIPLEHDRSRVLASVPGTSQAAEAVLLASIPQTATVDRKTVKAPDVAYNGDPVFQPIEQTTVLRAVNTDKDVLKVGDVFYLCFQGVWFTSKTATGPWDVAASIPQAIYQIPVSSPSHSVTYVTIQQSSPTTVVFAAAPAYTGLMIAWGCAVWGTGYYYPPYVHYGMHPIYYPHYPTYGYSAWYNPWTGTYGRSAAAFYGPYGGAGVTARYNPRTGTYARGAVAYGPYGARGVAEAYNPRTGTWAGTRQGAGVYGSWGQTAVTRGDDWVTSSRVTNDITGTTTRRTDTSQGGTAISRTGGPGGNSAIGVTGDGDVYAGHDGNVYRKDGDSWQKYEGGSWQPAEGATPRAQGQQAQQNRPPTGTTGTTGTAGTTAARPTTTSGYNPSQLNRDSTARREGTARTSDAGSVRSGATARSGSYRPTGRRR